MTYKVSGLTTHDCRVIVIKKNDWSIETNTLISGTAGPGGYFTYEVGGLDKYNRGFFYVNPIGLEEINYGNN